MSNPTTVSQAVAEREKSPSQMIGTFLDDFTRVVPSHIRPEAFVRLAQGALRRDEKLASVAMRNFGSLMVALLDCARLGHDPGTEAFYLIPFEGGKEGPRVEGWEGYRGVVERIYRAGAVRSVKAEVVRKNDHYRFFPTSMDVPEHEFDDFATDEDRGPLRGVYAYAEMVNGGFSRVARLSREQVMRRKALNPSANRTDSPWVKWEPSQWLKCSAHDLEKWVPSSTEYRRQEIRLQAEVAAERGEAPAVRGSMTPTVLVGEVVPNRQESAGEPDGAWPDVPAIPETP